VLLSVSKTSSFSWFMLPLLVETARNETVRCDTVVISIDVVIKTELLLTSRFACGRYILQLPKHIKQGIGLHFVAHACPRKVTELHLFCLYDS
jgi:hypothetical protein